MGNTVSFTGYLASRGARSGFDRDAAAVARLRLDPQTENDVRYVFCDWETACGVKSNHGAQVERVAAGIHREALHLVAGERRRKREASEVLSPVTGRFHKGGIPRAERGWRTETARPTGGSSQGGFPMRTITVTDRTPGEAGGFDATPVLCTVATTEMWAMLPRTLQGHRGPVRRERVVATYRALRALETRTGARNLVVLHLVYGQRDPNADYQAFNDLAPIVHLTETAIEFGAKATAALRRARSEHFADGLVVLDRIAHDRVVVEPKVALRDKLATLKGADRRMLIETLLAEARKLLAKASNALLRELREAA